MNTVKKSVHVAVGVLFNTQGEVLIAKRAEHVHQGGLWEFPGGKVEQDETVLDALQREFQEEVGVSIADAEPLMTIEHDYGDKVVLLDVWKSADGRGVAEGKEGQLVKWISVQCLKDYDFPQANQAIIDRLVENL